MTNTLKKSRISDHIVVSTTVNKRDSVENLRTHDVINKKKLFSDDVTVTKIPRSHAGKLTIGYK